MYIKVHEKLNVSEQYQWDNDDIMIYMYETCMRNSATDS